MDDADRSDDRIEATIAAGVEAARLKVKPPKHYTECNWCGAGHLKWRWDTDGWRLYETSYRVEHNRKSPHIWPDRIPSTEGFETLETEV